MTNSPTRARRRPRGITVLAIVFGASALPNLFALLADAAGGAIGGATTAGTGEALMAAYSGAVSALALAFAYGAWRLERWALLLGVAVQSVSVVVTVAGSVLTLGELDFGHAAAAALSAAIVFYLLTPPVRRAFAFGGAAR